MGHYSEEREQQDFKEKEREVANNANENNLELWGMVCATDPAHTKFVNQRGGYTSVKPQYQILEATKVFGSYGKGWGFEKIDMDYSNIESLGLVFVKAIFFYVQNGKKETFPINNSWSARQGARIDPDFVKKAETNTMSKALSKLGFSADIFMGEFDDPNYVEEVRNEKALEKAENKEEEQRKQELEWNEWKAKEIKAYDLIPNLDALKSVFTGHIRKVKRRGDDPAILSFTRAKDKRKEELENATL